MNEVIYILTNDCMPGLIKIGRTSTNPAKRMKDLFTTSLPFPFICFYAALVEDASFVEKKLHFAFGEQRVNPNREFFQIDPNRVRAVLELIAIQEVTPEWSVEVIPESGNSKIRRAPFRFSRAGIPIGAQLKFVRDENIVCQVVDDKSINFNGIITSLSNAAALLLIKKGWKSSQIQGPLYWLYENETLDERRQRVELG